MRRAFKIVVGVILVSIFAVIGLFASVFIGNRPLEDRFVLNGHAMTLNDGYVAIFLLPIGEGKFALIDCGNDPEAKVIKEELQRRGASSDAVEAILLTHGHPDHIAGCKVFTRAKIHGFVEDVKMAAGLESSKSPMGRMAGAQREKRAVVSDMLSDAQELQLGDVAVTAYHVPGHTPGSAAYLARSVLYVGDALTSKPDGSVIGPPWMFSEDKAQNARSVAVMLDRLKAEQRDVQMVAFSHTGALPGLNAIEAFVTATAPR